MNGRTSPMRVFGSSLVANPYTPQPREYVYKGDRPYVRPAPPAPGEQCRVDGCSTKRHSRDHCDKHYRAFKKYGTTTPPDRRRKETR